MSKTMRQLTVLAAGLAILACQAADNDAPAPDYQEKTAQWREKRETRIKADGGWLTVAGLFWLEEGANTFGSDPENDIVLPASAPARAGVFELTAGTATVVAEPGVELTVEDEPVTSMSLEDDASGPPTVLSLGPLTMHVINREDKLAIRLKDNQSQRRREFTQLDWYPIDESYRIRARFIEHQEPRTISIPNVLGQIRELQSPGYALFNLGDREVRLHPVVYSAEDKLLFYIFRDATAPEETYGAGRFLYSERPENDHVVLDFNKAHSPPCAFTDFATCPLPPKENRLSLRIEAGERKPPGAH